MLVFQLKILRRFEVIRDLRNVDFPLGFVVQLIALTIGL